MAAVLAEAEARRLPEQFQWWWLVARFLFPVVLRWRRRRPIIRGRAGRFRRLAWGHQRQFGSRIRSEEHTSELQSLMRISYAVFCLTKKKPAILHTQTNIIQRHNK